MAIEPLAAELAARNRSDDDLARLDANQAALTQAMARHDSQAELDRAFHAAVATAGKNRVLHLSREPVGMLLYAGLDALLPHLPQAPGRQLEAHGRIVEAIREQDPERASDWARRHIIDFRRGYEIAGLPMDAPMAPLQPEGDA